MRSVPTPDRGAGPSVLRDASAPRPGLLWPVVPEIDFERTRCADVGTGCGAGSRAQSPASARGHAANADAEPARPPQGRPSAPPPGPRCRLPAGLPCLVRGPSGARRRRGGQAAPGAARPGRTPGRECGAAAWKGCQVVGGGIRHAMEPRATCACTDVEDEKSIRCRVCGSPWAIDRGFIRSVDGGRPWGWWCTQCYSRRA
jgi:hypothetical protein